MSLSPLWRKRLRQRGLLWPLAKLPLPLAYRGAAALGRFDQDLADRYRAVALGLTHVFPDLANDSQRLSGWTRLHAQMRAREALDVFCMARFRAGYPIRLDEAALPVLGQAKQGERGAILVLSHFGRLNLLLLGLAQAGERLSILSIAVDDSNPDLDAEDRWYLGRKVHTLMGFLQGRWITLGQNPRALYQELAQGHTVVILLDAFVANRADQQERRRFPFLGGELTIAAGIERLAARTGAALVYGVAWEEGWRVRGELRPLPDDPATGLAAAVRELERDVLAAPWLWWQWNIIDYLWQPRGTREANP